MHPALHARAYGISYAALCAQVASGQAWLDLVAGKSLAQKLFDEAMPELGLPSGTFSAMRLKLGRADERQLFLQLNDNYSCRSSPGWWTSTATTPRPS